MPLRALNNLENFNAFEYDESSWQTLKTTYKNLNLHLPCCNAPAIPKTSKLGNFFFAHKNRYECTTEPESSEHIYLKSIIAKAAANAGWSVVTEFSGESKDGEKWIADVYCEKGKVRVALEVQLSYVTNEVLKTRTEKYNNSNVRVAWFLSKKFSRDFAQPCKAMPLFKINEFKPGVIPLIEDFELPVNEFVGALLSKKVYWKKIPSEYQILYIEDKCWSCKNNVKQVYGFYIDTYAVSAQTVPNASTVLLEILDIITNEELKALGLNYIGHFDKLKGNAPGYPYCNVCIYCNAPQNNYYLMERKKLSAQDEKFELFISYKDDIGEWSLLED